MNLESSSERGKAISRIDRMPREIAGEEYSLEKFKTLPDVTLTPEEREIVDTFTEKFREVTLRNHPLNMANVLRGILDLDTWKVSIVGVARNMPLLKKESQSKEGQLILAHDEAERLNEEYERKLKAVRDATDEFAKFVNMLNRGAPSEN